MNSISQDVERQIIATDRLRLLSLGYYISGAIGADLVSILLLHFFMLLAFSFIPPEQWNTSTVAPRSAQHALSSPSSAGSPALTNDHGPPAIFFRIFAGVIGL